MQIFMAASPALMNIHFLYFFLLFNLGFLPCNMQYIILARVIKLRAKNEWDCEVILKRIKVEHEKTKGG